MTTILRVYRSGRLVATVNELGHIEAHVASRDKPFVAYPYVDGQRLPAHADTMQQTRHWSVVDAKEDEDEQ